MTNCFLVTDEFVGGFLTALKNTWIILSVLLHILCIV